MKGIQTIILRQIAPISLLIILTAAVLVSCKSDASGSNSADVQRLEELQFENEQLKLDKQRKDSLYNESLVFYNEIQENLSAIQIKRDNIRIRSTDPELTEDDRQWILQEINYINFLREENAKKVKKLTKQISANETKMVEMQKMIDRLVSDMALKDQQIAELQQELNGLDQAYSKLFDAYQEKNQQVDDLKDRLNRVYYSYGTEAELMENKVLERRRGFIGLGRKVDLSGEMNTSYFAELDLTKDKEIFIEGSSIRVVSDHPLSSYDVVAVGNNSKIKIKNPREFWKITKYLVVLVE